MQLEWFIEISKGQNWGGGAHDLQYIEGLLTFLHPLNFIYLWAALSPRDLIVKGAGKLCIPIYETSVVVHEPQEALQFHDLNGVMGQFLIALTL